MTVFILVERPPVSLDGGGQNLKCQGVLRWEDRLNSNVDAFFGLPGWLKLAPNSAAGRRFGARR